MVRHHDRGKVASYLTWKRRGWCRLELLAADLATHNLVVLSIDSGEGTPKFVKTASDALRNAVGVADL